MGRNPMDLTSRRCKICGDICPIEQFCRPSKKYQSGFVLETKCRACYRQYQRTRKQMQYADPAKRQVILDRARKYRALRMPDQTDAKRNDLCSSIAWVTNRCETILAGGKPGSVIVYLIEGRGALVPHDRDAERPWRGKSWAIREHRPGIVPPRGGIPLMRIVGISAFPHSLCPDGWRWVAKYTGNWLRRRYQEND
jgi:hypothetical protein